MTDDRALANVQEASKERLRVITLRFHDQRDLERHDQPINAHPQPLQR